ncbi:AMP-binding protein [Nocardia sp. NPDC006630]|uniref:class I adenylate-forming enzyme family protein n=1 Tax=Nocardia sp. NPDC006630 TaxID=3157181 RepID=UPI0033BBCD92
MVEMIESGFADRTLLGAAERRVNGAELGALAKRGAATLRASPSVVYAGENHPLLPVALFAAACAGVPFVPVNYRLEDAQLNALIERQPGAFILADAATAPRLPAGAVVFDDWLAGLPAEVPAAEPLFDDEQVAVLLYTSGTTAAPKSALLRHRHLMAYLLGTVEFGGATAEEAVLVSVPPYHVAGVANMLSNLFAGRRIVYLRAFDPSAWLDTVRAEAVTNAMLVPTMLARIVDVAAERGPVAADVATLRSLSYGGAKISERVVREALARFPAVGFVNAYGLTETASTIAVLGPEDHRAALVSDDPMIRARLASAGQVLPAVELEIRDDDDRVLPAGKSGIVFVRGEQISGEYSTGSLLDENGWFCTRDRGHVDAEGYLYLEGRADDTIIRGGENIAPAEIEEVLLSHPAVAEACVVGPPSEEWGQTLAAAVVLRAGAVVTGDELRELVRARLRGSKTPETVVFRDSLPHTDTGKLLRRNVLADLTAQEAGQRTIQEEPMTVTLTPGARVFSAVDSTELIVVRAPAGPVELTIGGAPAVLAATEKNASALTAAVDGGSAIGKRYTNSAGTVELLCTRPGSGLPAIAGEDLVLKQAKPLPASD